MRNCYEVLGLSADTDYETLKSRYQQLKAKYSEERFAPGEAGNVAAKNLSELEVAWADIEQTRKIKEQSAGGTDYEYIDRLIKDKKYDEAQTMLDRITDRNAEWHFLQSIIYYKRDWLSECKSQLESAVALDPGNQKYKEALEKLKIVMGNPQANADTIGVEDTGTQQTVDQEQMGNALSNCCLAYCFTSLCCDFMRCCM